MNPKKRRIGSVSEKAAEGSEDHRTSDRAEEVSTEVVGIVAVSARDEGLVILVQHGDEEHDDDGHQNSFSVRTLGVSGEECGRKETGSAEEPAEMENFVRGSEVENLRGFPDA